MTRFQSGENFAYATNSGAATCSFSLSAATRGILIESITGYSDLAAAVITIQASGTTLWAMRCGSAGTVAHFNGLGIDPDAAQTLSANITGTAQCDLAVCGKYRLL